MWTMTWPALSVRRALPQLLLLHRERALEDLQRLRVPPFLIVHECNAVLDQRNVRVLLPRLGPGG